jgi:hypothetical protein
MLPLLLLVLEAWVYRDARACISECQNKKVAASHGASTHICDTRYADSLMTSL